MHLAYELEIEADENGYITLIQPMTGEDDQRIVLAPTQIPALIDELQKHEVP